MTNIKDKIISGISEEFEIGGFYIYLNKKNGKLAKLPKNDFLLSYTEKEITELYKKDIKEIEENKDDYIKIKEMPHKIAYDIMKEFVDEVIEDDNLKNRLTYALNKREPFEKFTYEIEYYEKYMNLWLEFKKRRLKEWIENQLDEVKINFDLDLNFNI
ncbi:MAG: hypothetical protein GY756_02820 [bacterium]|nr:hypothetical protein [bacterium]